MSLKTRITASCLLAIAGLCTSATASAGAIIDGGTINGFHTFQEVATGRIWMDMDSFADSSTDDMVAAASAAGFTFATKADVQQLLGSLPLGSGEWASYKPVMGSSPTREAIWGTYDDGGAANTVGWAFASDVSGQWYFQDNVAGSNFVGGDMNIWAFMDASPVPEPASRAVWGLVGSLGLLVSRRRRKRIAA